MSTLEFMAVVFGTQAGGYGLMYLLNSPSPGFGFLCSITGFGVCLLLMFLRAQRSPEPR